MGTPTDSTGLAHLRITDEKGRILSVNLCPNYYCSDLFKTITTWERMDQRPQAK